MRFGLGLSLTQSPPRPSGEGGGGGEPEWVPDGAVAHVDFETVPVRAYAGGSEVADLTTILGDSVLMNVVFAPADIVEGVGFTNVEAGDVALIGALRTALQSDFTMQIEFVDRFRLEITEETFGTDIVAKHINGQQPSLTDGNVAVVTSSGTAGPHKMAFTVTDASSYASVDNVKLDDEGDPPVTTADLAMPNVPTDIILLAGSGIVKRFTIYNPIKTENQTQALTT